MSGTEEVPNTRPTRKPIYWKETSLLEKAWYMFSDWLPILLWIAFGLGCIYLGGLKDDGQRRREANHGERANASLFNRLESGEAHDTAAESYRADQEGR